MDIGTIKEIKDSENRVGLTPEGVGELARAGNNVFVQAGAGLGSGFEDSEYEEAGAKILEGAEEVVKAVDVLMKVKEPLPEEYGLLEMMKGKVLFTFLHLAGAEEELTRELMRNEIAAIAYETVEADGELPLLAPMSDVAGVVAIQYAAHYLQRKYGGRGVCLGRVRNTDPAKVMVIGAGHVGATAAKTALGLGSEVYLFDIDETRLVQLNAEFLDLFGDVFCKNLRLLNSKSVDVGEYVKGADVLVGAVLVAGGKAPQVVSEEQVKAMKKGAVIVDIAIDQGGCIWGSRVTSHSDPIYELEGKLYCCIPNVPGQVSLHSTQALTRATLPYLLKMGKEGVLEALRADAGFLKGLNVYKGKIVCKAVAEALGRSGDYVPVDELL